jgi:hypothetical protein
MTVYYSGNFQLESFFKTDYFFICVSGFYGIVAKNLMADCVGFVGLRHH